MHHQSIGKERCHSSGGHGNGRCRCHRRMIALSHRPPWSRQCSVEATATPRKESGGGDSGGGDETWERGRSGGRRTGRRRRRRTRARSAFMRLACAHNGGLSGRVTQQAQAGSDFSSPPSLGSPCLLWSECPPSLPLFPPSQIRRPWYFDTSLGNCT